MPNTTRDIDKIKEIVKNPNFICFNCARVAENKENLCREANILNIYCPYLVSAAAAAAALVLSVVEEFAAEPMRLLRPEEQEGVL